MAYLDRNGAIVYEDTDLPSVEEVEKKSHEIPTPTYMEHGTADNLSDAEIESLERQNRNKYEPRETVQHYGSVENLSDSEIDFLERQNKSKYEPRETVQHYGSVENLSDSEIDFLERQKASKFKDIKNTVMHYGSVENMSEADIKSMEAQVKEHKDELNKKYDLADEIINVFPRNINELEEKLGSLNYELLPMKRIVESYRDKFFEMANKYKKDFTPESSAIVNQALYEYLCILEALKKNGYTFGELRDSYTRTDELSTYKPDVKMTEVLSIIYNRGKEGSDVRIPVPVEYDMDGEKLVGPANFIIKFVDDDLRSPRVNMDVWRRIGVKEREVKSL